MLSLKDFEHSHDNSSESILLNPNIDSELKYWRKLVFSFDMDGGDSNNNNNNSSSSSHDNNPDDRNARSRSHSRSNVPIPPRTEVQDAILLAQFAAAGGLSQPQTTHDPSYNALILALLQAQNSQHAAPNFQSAISPQLYGQQSTPHSNFGAILPQFQLWPPAFAHQQPQGFPYSLPELSAATTGYPQLPPINTNVPSTSVAAQNSPLTAASRATSPGSTDPVDPNITEDKRRRNTAASARFRIKKKQRNLNLERTVSDLTGRADELEKEAADLRRENGWLKEIVMLKGSRLAGLDVSPQNLPKPPDSDASFWSPAKGSSQPVASSSRKPNDKSREPEDSDSGDDSDEYSDGQRGGASSSKGKERQK